MSDLTAKLKWNGGFSFTSINGGIETAIDGNKKSGASPVELLLDALGACSAIDVVSILEKMKSPATKLEVTMEADRNPKEPRYLTAASMLFDVWGDAIAPDKLIRAINLSVGKYCSVYHSLRHDLKLQSKYRIHETGATASGDYQDLEMSMPTGELI